MANSLIPFDASEVKKSAQEILAETNEIKYQFSREGTVYHITPQGREFVEKWLRAEELE
jgi:DNA-binding PadR family transcriptional regulator